jgi:hypothetical protein
MDYRTAAPAENATQFTALRRHDLGRHFRTVGRFRSNADIADRDR